jgi:hypothetical protein
LRTPATIRSTPASPRDEHGRAHVRLEDDEPDDQHQQTNDRQVAAPKSNQATRVATEETGNENDHRELGEL